MVILVIAVIYKYHTIQSEINHFFHSLSAAEHLYFQPLGLLLWRTQPEPWPSGHLPSSREYPE